MGDLPAFSYITNNLKFESRICYLREFLKIVKINILHLLLSHLDLQLNYISSIYFFFRSIELLLIKQQCGYYRIGHFIGMTKCLWCIFWCRIAIAASITTYQVTQRISPISEVYWYQDVLSTLPVGFEPAAHCLEGSCFPL